MTLDTAVSKALYLGNGTARQFPLDFKVWDASELLIFVSGKGREVLDVTAQCDIRLTDSGGIVTYPREGAPLPEGCTLSIVRNMPFTQGIDLVSASRFDPQVIEDGLDQATAERQQLLEQLSRAVILPPTSRESPQQVVENVYAARDEAGQSAKRADASQAAAADCAARACDCADAAATEADRAKSEADRAQNLANIGPATPASLGMVRIGDGIGIDENGVIFINPWDIFPLRVPIAVDGVRFGGSDGRRAIMPGETDARENWVACDGGTDGKGGTVPDLRGRMIMGASSSYPAGSTGGSTTHEHSLSGTVGETTLTEAQLASHYHKTRKVQGWVSGGLYYLVSNPHGNSGSTDNYLYADSTSVGNSQSHDHSLKGSTEQANSLPPYYALSYIMRVA
ncbi:hypothetical protein [Desulfovibrio sp. ZJ369]|uniref:hypothetical protein n=1 Tax=Desulfovibrio sp. ZJ369 TaxID=2709793 RepID=UPI0013EB74AC|nr:hypothetical protein [Desulfovibrio sp. ZJ369]